MLPPWSRCAPRSLGRSIVPAAAHREPRGAAAGPGAATWARSACWPCCVAVARAPRLRLGVRCRQLPRSRQCLAAPPG
eukprot:10688876-Lingulodinium_polyedra.AAC.1